MSDIKTLSLQKIKDATRENEVTYDDDNDYEELAEMKSVGDAAEISEAMIDEE